MNKVWKRKKKWTRGRTEPGQYMAEWEKYFEDQKWDGGGFMKQLDDLRAGILEPMPADSRPLMEVLQDMADNMEEGIRHMNQRIYRQNQSVLFDALKNVYFPQNCGETAYPTYGNTTD